MTRGQAPMVRAGWTNQIGGENRTGGLSGSAPDPEFSAFGSGLAVQTKTTSGRECHSRANPGCRIVARVALQRGPVLRSGRDSVSKAGNVGACRRRLGFDFVVDRGSA